MSDVQIQVINAETEDNLTGIIIDGVPYLYWLRVYKALGITRAHAVEVIKRLTEGVHYRKFSKEELQQLSGTVNVSSTVDTRARAFYFLTQEGMNRAYIEIDTNRMNDQGAIDKVNKTRDKIANIYTRYLQGEILSKIADEEKTELPGDVNTAAIINQELEIADSFIKHICPHLKVDPGLVTSACLTQAELKIQKQGGTANLSYLKGIIPRLLSGDPASLTPSQIGAHFSLPATRINDLLEKLGYQISTYRKSESSGLRHKEWTPTEKGEPHGEWKPVTIGHRNGSIHNGYKWYWKLSILDEFRAGIFGEVQNIGQQQLTAAAAGGA